MTQFLGFGLDTKPAAFEVVAELQATVDGDEVTLTHADAAKLDYLAKVACRVREVGRYVSKAQAGQWQDDGTRTYSTVSEVDAHQHGEVCDFDRALATKALEWAKTQRGSEFADKLRQVATKSKVEVRDRAVLAYAVGGLLREREQAVRDLAQTVKAAEAAGAAHLGTVGERGTFGPLTVDRTHGFASDWGWTTAYTFRADDGGEAVWFTTADTNLQDGDVVTLVAMVKSHGDYRGIPQTKLSRVRVISNPVGDERMRVARERDLAYRAELAEARERHANTALGGRDYNTVLD